jgi:hemolysin activation/secretion protein
VRSGYVTSGAYLPLQDLSDGTVVVQVVEGQLEKIEIRGLDRLQESYVRDRFREASQPPLKVDRISEALQLLEFNPLFQRVRADLKEGTSPGLSVLVVELKEAPAFSLGWQFDNYESPAIGEYKGTIFIEHQNLLGFGDRLSASYSLTEGLDKYEIGYKIPFNAKDGTIEVEYNSGDNRIVEKFEELGIRAESDRFSVLVRQPLVKRSTEEIALFFSVDLQESRTFILEDIPFSFTEGSEEGKSRVTALRLGQEWISRSSNRVLAA